MTVITFIDPKFIVLNLLNSQLFPDIMDVSPSYYFALSLLVVFFRNDQRYSKKFSDSVLVVFFSLCALSVLFNMRLSELTLFGSLFYLIFFVPQFLDVTLVRFMAWNLLILSAILFIKMSFFNIDDDLVNANVAQRGINRIGAIRGNSNTLAFYLGMCLFFIRQSEFGNKLLVFLNVVVLSFIFFTGSRTGIFVAVVSLIYALKKLNFKIRLLVMFSFGFLFYFIFYLYEDYINILIELTESELLDGAETSRSTILLKYLNTLSDPNFSYFYGYNEFYQIKFGSIIHNDPLIIASHNTFMQVFLKYGLFSLLLFFLYFIVNIRYRNWRVNFVIFFMPFLLTVGIEGNKIFYIALIVLAFYSKNINNLKHETLQ